MTAPTAVRPVSTRGRGWLLVLVGAVAFAFRLTPVLRGGGLYGLLGYDGGVYYVAAAGLAHGLLPYADYLLLHPPGITLALLPFGLLGRLIGDAHAMAVARLAWMGLGAVSAALVGRILWRHGRLAALAGGLVYAIYPPAIFVERTTALEAVTAVCTLGAVLLLTRAGSIPPWLFVAAGALLGASTGTKIWGIVLLVVLAGWCMAVHGTRRALLVLAGAAGALVAICLPFFLAAPVQMWRMVVEAQLGRRRVPVELSTKLVDVAGLSQTHVRHETELLLLTAAAVVAAGVLAWSSRVGRLAVVLLVVALGLLYASPAWSTDYASLTAAPLALLGGAAIGRLWTLARSAGARVVLGLAVLGVLFVHALSSAPNTTFGPSFPGRSLARQLDVPGCVTSDDPAALVATEVLQRNIARGCPLMADLGGYSYYLQPGAALRVGRASNEQWQRFVLDYFASGDAVMVVRFRDNVGFSRATRDTITSWSVIGGSGPYEIRSP